MPFRIKNIRNSSNSSRYNNYQQKHRNRPPTGNPPETKPSPKAPEALICIKNKNNERMIWVSVCFCVSVFLIVTEFLY